MRFDLYSLSLFVTVCEQQSIARAAEMHNIAASAVSKRISDLEKLVKEPLFYRRQSGLELTPVAQSLLHHARIVLRDLMQMERELTDHSTGLRGQVRIQTSLSMIVQHLPGDLSEFLAENPAVRVDIEESTSQQVVRSVSENAADIGIFGGSLSAPGLRIAHYRDDKLVAIMPPGHVLSGRQSVRFAELAEHDLIATLKGSFLDSLVLRAAADVGQPLKLRVRVNGFETAARMVEAGLGIAFVPENCAERYVKVFRIASVPLDEAWATRHWRLCTRDTDDLPLPVKVLVKYLTRLPSGLPSGLPRAEPR